MTETEFTTHRGEALIAPRHNINGTSAKELLQGWSAAHMAIGRAAQALGKTLPHGRDFLTCEDPAEEYRKARAQHHARMETLTLLGKEISDLANTVMAQNTGRSASGVEGA